MKPATPQAFRLFTEGAAALSRMESVGMPLCPVTLAQSGKDIDERIRKESDFLRSQPIYEAQRRLYGRETGIGKREQLAKVLYDEMKLPGATRSKKTGKYVLDDDVLDTMDDIPYIKTFRTLSKLMKIKSTYIEGLGREAIGGRVYGFLNLHKVKSYRGSADSPNLNNLPSRGSLARYVKQCIRPKPGHYLVEIDYSALEVHIATCYHHDPTMTQYLEDGYDMHTDMSKECFRYDDAWKKANPKLHKAARNDAKAMFTFAEFYGDVYFQVARNLWKAASKLGLHEHLASQGIKRLGMEYDDGEGRWVERHGDDAFVTHIKAVEKDFWHRRFPVYTAWKDEWNNAYKKHGYFHTLTGFAWHGVEKKNFVINAPVQGSAAHCLFQSIIDIDKAIRQRKMDTKLFLEIHDSLLAEVPAHELHDYVATAREIMTTKLQEKWPWICVDLKVECEASPISWADKVAYTGNE